MAITQADLLVIKALNPALRINLYPDTNGVANNRIIIYGIPSHINSAIVINTNIVLTGIQWQKAYYHPTRQGLRMYYKNIAVGIGSGTTPVYRYLRVQGYGTTYAGQATYSRIIELEAWSGGVNLLAGKIAKSYGSITAGSMDIATVTDGVKTAVTNTYPIWTSALPNANIVYDFGTPKVIDSLIYYSYSTSGDLRVNRFKFQGSADGITWTDIWDMSTHSTVQPILPSGYTINY